MASFKKLAERAKGGRQVAQADEEESNLQRRKRELEQMGTGRDLTPEEKKAKERTEERERQKGREKAEQG